MKYSKILPCDELKPYVSHFWTCTWDRNPMEMTANYYIVANSMTELTFAFAGPPQSTVLTFSALQGQTNQPRQFPVIGFTQLIGVSLYSHAIPILFRIPANTLNHTFLSLESFLGREGHLICERIALAPSTAQRLKVLEDFLKHQSQGRQYEDKLMNQATEQIIKSGGVITVYDLANQYYLSQKQFVRRFKDFSGFNPKVYARIIRFETFLNHDLSRNRMAEAAYASGFYDHAHFVNEFKTLSGLRPRDFWKLSD